MRYLNNSNLDKIFNDVDNLLTIKGRKAGYSREVYEHIVEFIVLDLVKENKINNIDYENIILIMFDECVEKISQGIKHYVRDILYKKTDLLLGIPFNDIVLRISDNVMYVGQLNYYDLMSGKYDDYIVGYATSRRNSVSSDNARNYVLEKIKFVNDLKLSDDEISEISDLIVSELHDNYGKEFNDIYKGKYDDIMFRLFYRKIMCNASVQNDSKPKEIVHKTKKRKISTILKKLVITALIVGSFGASTYVVNGQVKELQYQEAYSDIIHYEDFHYKSIYSPDNEMIVPTAINVLDFYNKISADGIDVDTYGMLGFFTAYHNIKQDKLYVMETVFKVAKNNAANNLEYTSFYKAVQNDRCYLEFVMNRLKSMGCEKILEDKYSDILETYIKVKKEVNDGKILDNNVLIEEQEKLVHEIISLYREYSKKAMIELDKLLEENNLYSNNSGRVI